MDSVFHMLYSIQKFLWNGPMLVLLLGTHLYFTVQLKFIQKKISEGIRLSLSGKGQGKEGISSFSALATALAATIGTGNIIGISMAVSIGGPGAVFWCWLTGLLGIATCYAECFLSVKYREKQEDGTYAGGPMYVMEKVLHQKGAAVLFSAAVILVSFGMGSGVQSHAVCTAVTEHVEMNPVKIGMITAVLTGIVILGGAKQIAKVCTWLVPIMSVLYLGGCLVLIWTNRAVLGETIGVIVKAAWTPQAVLGGTAGTVVTTGVRIGIARGLFTNEAGLGSIPMAAASAQTSAPEQQSLVSMTGPFWDTVVMCAITGIAVVSSMIQNPEVFREAPGDRLCFLAFSRLPFWGSEILSVSLILFAFATIIGWNYYGECAVRYLWKGRGLLLYQVLYMAAVYVGAVMSSDRVWSMSDLFNALMALPNLLCIWRLRREVVIDAGSRTAAKTQNVHKKTGRFY